MIAYIAYTMLFLKPLLYTQLLIIALCLLDPFPEGHAVML